MKLREKIYIVEPELYEQYSLISHMDSCVVNSYRNARIHLRQTYIKETCEANDDDIVLSIHLSAMYWANWECGPFVRKISGNACRVCFATHNSLSEIRDFLAFLKPKNVYLNVVPSNITQRNEMLNLLADIQRQYNVDESKPVEQTTVPKKFSFDRIRSLTSRTQGNSKKARIENLEK